MTMDMSFGGEHGYEAAGSMPLAERQILRAKVLQRHLGHSGTSLATRDNAEIRDQFVVRGFGVGTRVEDSWLSRIDVDSLPLPGNVVLGELLDE